MRPATIRCQPAGRCSPAAIPPPEPRRKPAACITLRRARESATPGLPISGPVLTAPAGAPQPRYASPPAPLGLHRLPDMRSCLPARNRVTSTAIRLLSHRHRTRQRPHRYSRNHGNRRVILPILRTDGAWFGSVAAGILISAAQNGRCHLPVPVRSPSALTTVIVHITVGHDTELQKQGAQAVHGTWRRTAHRS